MDSAPGSEQLRLSVSSRSGRVVVRAERGARLSVDGGRVEESEGTTHVRGRGAVSIRCPEGTDLMVGAVSGRVECHGRFGSVSVTTASGRVDIEAAESIDVRTLSGRIDIDHCSGHCRAVAKSGRITIGRAESVEASSFSGRIDVGATGDADLRAVSGRVELATDRGTNVKVRSMSGEVRVSVPDGATPATRLKARVGSVRCECEPGDDGSIDVETIAGSIRVTCRH
jgi:DUF4097 and DUF4098 domain-containing protein YvlB